MAERVGNPAPKAQFKQTLASRLASALALTACIADLPARSGGEAARRRSGESKGRKKKKVFPGQATRREKNGCTAGASKQGKGKGKRKAVAPRRV